MKKNMFLEDFGGLSKGCRRAFEGLSKGFRRAFEGLSNGFRSAFGWLSEGFRRAFGRLPEGQIECSNFLTTWAFYGPMLAQNPTLSSVSLYYIHWSLRVVILVIYSDL